MTSTLDGDSIASALDIIDLNGGLGEWETGVTETTTARWLFPRTPGAENIGRCSAKSAAHKRTHQKNTKCADFNPDPGGMYLSRTGLGPYDTDVETIAAWLDAPRNVSAGSCCSVSRVPERPRWLRLLALTPTE